MLTNEEMLELVNKSKQGDDLAKEQLITLNSPLIKSIVKRYLNKGVDYDDLFQLGALGFVKAIYNYDQNFNVKFTTYAVPMIAGEIKRFLRDDGSLKISRSIKHNSMQIKNFILDFQKEKGNQPTIEQISNHFNMDMQDVVLCMEASTNLISLNEKLGDDEDSNTMLDRLADNFSVEGLINKMAIREIIKNLSKKEKQIIIMRYYFDKTQSEIAKELGVSQVQISRIENKILNEIKENII